MSHRLSTLRVANRYLSAIVVSPRRGREYAMYRGFLERFKRDLAAVEAHRGLIDKAEDVLWGLDLTDAMPHFAEEHRALDQYESALGDRVDLPFHKRDKGYYEDLYWTGQNLRYPLERMRERLNDWTRPWAQKLSKALASDDFESEVAYSDLTPAEVKQLEGLPALMLRLPDEVDTLLKRMERLRDTESDEIPAAAEVGATETLYHASVKARELYSKGFSLTMPEDSASAGLGGSQSAGGGKKGISFSEDAYVTKEIARVFKEVVMIARGEVGVREINEWVRRKGITEEVIDWYKHNYFPSEDKFRYYLKPGRDGVQLFESVYEPDEPKPVMKRVDLRKLFKGPVDAMALYLCYLNFSGRYDPKFFGVGGPTGLVRRFKSLNPKDIGYIAATIDMTNPDITYGRGEREYRVPPEAVLSVDRFIS